MIEYTPEGLAYLKTQKFPGRPTIIFLHDSLGCIELWRNFPDRLGELTKCNVLVYDRFGYGKSPGFITKNRENDYMEKEADLLIKLLGFWKVEKPFLFGHSDGGSIALIAAGKYPDKIATVITEGAHIFVEDITLKGIRESMGIYKTTDLKQKLERYHGDKTDAMFWAWTATWSREDFKNWNIEDFLPFIECPSLIIQGEDDEYGSLKQVEGIINQTKGISESLIIPKVKHTPHKEVPELVLEKVNQFFERILLKAN